MLIGINTIPARHRLHGSQDDRFLLRLIETAGQVQPNTKFVVFTHARNHEMFGAFPRVPVEERTAGPLGFLRGENAAMEEAVQKPKIDALLSPLDAPSARPPGPQVLYALDVAPWEPCVDGSAPAKVPPAKAVKKAATEARAVLVSSEYVRRRCLELFEVPLNKVVVAPPGVNPGLKTPQPPFVEPPYILVLADVLAGGVLGPIRELFARRRGEFGQTLVVAGPHWEGEPEDWGPGVLRVERCADPHFASLCQHSAACLCPGLHDGCGMQVLAALQAGASVAAPNTGALQELAGHAPVYYNAANLDSLVQALRRILDEDPKKREERVHVGRSAASKFTWDKTAWKLLNAFRKQ